MTRIAASTGEVDKRTLNGNNGTKRGEDKKERSRPCGYYTLKDEVRASLRTRLEIVLDFYGGKSKLAKAANVTHAVVSEWCKRGMISAKGAQKLHGKYKRTGEGYRASFIRPDLRFDSNGKPLTLRCDRREMLRVVKKEDLATKPPARSWRKIKEENMKKREAEKSSTI